MTEENKNLETPDEGAATPKADDKNPDGKVADNSAGEYRERTMEFMRSLDPDVEVNDDNYLDVLEHVMAEKVIPKIGAYDEANNNLRAMIQGNPKLGAVLTDMSKGARFEEALPRHFDIESLEPQEGDPDYSVWGAAKAAREKEYQEQLAKEKAFEENQAASAATINDWFAEKALSESEQQEYGAFVQDTLKKAYEGAVTPDFLDKMYHAMKYNNDVETAAKAGEIKGKNAAIVEDDSAMTAAKRGDNLPVIDGGAQVGQGIQTPDNADPLVQGLRGMAERRSVLNGNN